jgi:hypothetical protein
MQAARLPEQTEDFLRTDQLPVLAQGQNRKFNFLSKLRAIPPNFQPQKENQNV